MWYDIGIYVIGALTGVTEVLQVNPWILLRCNTSLSLGISWASLISSSSGSFFGIWRFYFGTHGEGLWVAIVAFEILFLVNLSALVCRYWWIIPYFLRKQKQSIPDPLSTYINCLLYGDIGNLKALLERDYPGIQVDDDLLRIVLRFRGATKEGMVTYLKELRIKTPLADRKAREFARRELQAILIATLCVKSLMKGGKVKIKPEPDDDDDKGKERLEAEPKYVEDLRGMWLTTWRCWQ